LGLLTPCSAVSLGYFEYAPAVVIGAFKCRRHSGSIKRKVNAILVSIGLTMVITAIILFSKPFLPFIGALAIITFAVSLLSFMVLERL
jgi:heme/copper-type cytochrome/quinol oxidase subunit 4